MSTPEIIAFGCLTNDNVVRSDGEILAQSQGGNVVYSALGARVWNDNVGMVSRYGDGYPDTAIDRLRDLGLNTDGIRKLPRRHLLNVAFAYQADGSRTRVIPPHLLDQMSDDDRERFYDTSTLPDGRTALTDFAPDGDDVPEDWWDRVRGIHCASFALIRLAHVAATARARRPNVWIGVDSPWHDYTATKAEDATGLFRDIDLVLPSEQDLENYRAGADQNALVLNLLAQGARAVALKRGPNGCRLFQQGPGLLADVPVVSVNAIDPTGAGDSFCGGFMAGFRLTGDLRMAAHYGVVSASFCVAQPGIEGLIHVDRDEAHRRLDALSLRTGTTIIVKS